MRASRGDFRPPQHLITCPTNLDMDMSEDKWLERLKILTELINGLPHGKAVIDWQDKTIVKIEKIQTEAVIKK